jgi:osmotically-inducible protein OsmY
MKAKHYSIPIVAAFALLMNSGPLFASATDESIETAAKESYIFKTFLKNDTVTITSTDGVVTLTGFVAEEPHKELAQETVANLDGVKSVDNQLEIKSEAVKSGDALINARVKLELLSHGSLSASSIDVQVQDGIVTLTGEASDQAQIDLTTEYIEDVEGVKDVKNNMVALQVDGTPAKTLGDKAGEVGKRIGDTVIVVGRKLGRTTMNIGESIDDASITALVKATLLYHRSTSALKTKVETEDGIVSLGGTAKNGSEKELTSKFVNDVSGVKSVVNNMTIKGANTD